MNGAVKDEAGTPAGAPDGLTPHGAASPGAAGSGASPAGATPQTPESVPAAAAVSAAADDVSPPRKAPYLRVVGGSDDVGAERSEPVAAAPAPEPAPRTGQRLRETREGKQIELEQVARDLRIPVSTLRSIEEMTLSNLGQPAVVLRGHIRTYAGHLKLDPKEIIGRYQDECAILKDPAPTPSAPPAPERRFPVGVVAGAGVALAAGAAGFFFLTQGRGAEAPAPEAAVVESAAPNVSTAAAAPAVTAPAAGPPLTIVALERAWIEVRAADGTKFRSRFFEAGESYAPRVGAGWTVTAHEGGAFEWRLGDVSLGKLAPEGGRVYAQSVDQALNREPILVAPADVPADSAMAGTDPALAASASDGPSQAAAAAPRPTSPRPAAPRAPAPAQPAPAPAEDPSAAAYDDSIPIIPN